MTLTEARAKVTITRPADTTAYAAKDSVSSSTSAPTVLTFYNMCVAGAGATIRKARFMTDQSTNTARFRLHLFHTSPSAINDNAAFTLLYSNVDKRIGAIDFPLCQTEGTGSTAANALNDLVELSFTSVDGHIYGLLETLDAFTPASAQLFHVELSTE